MAARYMLVTYIKNSIGKHDEITSFRNNLKLKHYQTATVILDFKHKTCVVNKLNREADFESMLEMYKRLIGDKLTPHLPQ